MPTVAILSLQLPPLLLDSTPFPCFIGVFLPRNQTENSVTNRHTASWATAASFNRHRNGQLCTAEDCMISGRPIGGMSGYPASGNPLELRVVLGFW